MSHLLNFKIMSRIGNSPIEIKEGVNVTRNENIFTAKNWYINAPLSFIRFSRCTIFITIVN